ncbi:Uncharacterised protein [Serratia fonticola]|uniref:Uncharacterized protein n=1 Tax=Serratia fonticola TaxID=47917 RepID=A0A4U9TWU2_SERFO|nr:Uncharacterised protein [Serratia fonticola]
MAPEAQAEGFIDDSTLTGGVYYWQRQRDRKDVETGDFKTNLSHSTWNANLDFNSGYAADMFGHRCGRRSPPSKWPNPARVPPERNRVLQP